MSSVPSVAPLPCAGESPDDHKLCIGILLCSPVRDPMLGVSLAAGECPSLWAN